MKRVWPILVFGLGMITTGMRGRDARAQVNVQTRGYLEHQFGVNLTDGEWTYLDYDRFRVDARARAGKGTLASAGVVWQLYRGDTRLELSEYLPDRLATLADSSAIELKNRHYINHAFILIQPGRLELVVGKQFLTWGAAWVFNPTELFRPKNVLEPTYEREGIGALAAKLPLGSFSDVQVAFVPDGGFSNSGKLIRARQHVSGFDVSALAAVLHESVAVSDFHSAQARKARRVTIGGDVTGELLGLGVWAEATWSDHARRQWVEATAGGNYTLNNGTLLLFEAYYNGRGEWHDPYSASLWTGRLSGDLRSMGIVTLFGHSSRLVRELWTLGFSSLVNVGDPSLVLIPSVAYSFAQDVDILFNGLIYAGGEEAEYSGGRYGGFLRARVYF